jgi:hypothetical protein
MEERLDGGVHGMEIGFEEGEDSLLGASVLGFCSEDLFKGDAAFVKRGSTEVSSASFEAVDVL